MSAFGGKADTDYGSANVRLRPKADITWLLENAISCHSFSCRKLTEKISEFVIEDASPMSVLKAIFMHMCGRPRGLLGTVGGHIMARTNAECGAWVSDLLQIASNDSVLEVGFGPGVLIIHLSKLAPAGRIAGIDPSIEMVEQARARNIIAFITVVSPCSVVLWRACRSVSPFPTRWSAARMR